METYKIVIQTPDKKTGYFWEQLEDKLSQFLWREGITGSIENEITLNSTEIRNRGEK